MKVAFEVHVQQEETLTLCPFCFAVFKYSVGTTRKPGVDSGSDQVNLALPRLVVDVLPLAAVYKVKGRTRRSHLKLPFMHLNIGR